MMDFENVSLHWINRLSFLVRRELADKFKLAGHNVGAEEWAVLLLFWKKDGRAPSEIADATIRDRTTITRFLDAMEKKQFIERKVDPSDRRRAQVFLTPAGRDLKQKLVPIASQIIDKAQQGLDAQEQAQLVKLLRKMTSNLTE